MGSVLWRLSNDQSSIQCELVVKGDGVVRQVRVRSVDNILTAIDVTSLGEATTISARLKRAFLNDGYREEP